MEEPPQSTPPLRRRNSISTPVPIPSKLTIPPTSSLPNGTASSFELISLKSSSFISYTSLKDILPSSPSAAVNSPTAGSAANSSYEITIRNRLVKQAAWAYLQPMSASPGSSGPHFFRRVWMRFFAAQSSISSCLCLIRSHIISGLSRSIELIRRAIFVQVGR